MTRSLFQLCTSHKLKQSSCLRGNIGFNCASRDSSKGRDQLLLLLVWRREETRRVRCTARRTQASEPTLNAFGLAPKRRAECARVSLSWYFVPVFHNVTDCFYCSLRKRIHGEGAPSALLLVSRPEPAPVDCSLATERRAVRRPRVGREATSLYSCVTTQLIDRSASASCCG